VNLATSLRLVSDDFLLALDPVEILRRNGYRPDPWQVELLESKAPRIFVLSPRQRGKSTASAAYILHEMLFVPGTVALIVSKSLNQAREWMKRLKELHRPFSGRWPTGSDNVASLEIYGAGWPDGVVSRCISVPHGDAARGYSPTILVIDECGFIPDENIAAVLPALEATRGRLIALTTPSPAKADRRWARTVWESVAGWHKIDVTPDRCPRIVVTHEEFERKRAEVGEARFRREYLGKWHDEDDPSNPRLASRETVARLRARQAASDDDEAPMARAS